MELRNLECFVSVAEFENFTTAAKFNHISQSTLSKRISDLEYELKVRLFNRSKSYVMLTDEGAQLLPVAKAILEQNEIFTNRAKTLFSTGVGFLNIGYSGYWDYDFLCEIIPKFSREHPYVDFSFTREHHGLLNYLIRKEHYDIVFSIKSEDESINSSKIDQTDWFPLATSPMCIMVSKDHRLAKKDHITLKDLEEEQLIIVSKNKDSLFHSLITSAFVRQGLKCNFAPYSPGNSFDAVLLVLANKGYIFSNEFVALTGNPKIKVIPVPEMGKLVFGIIYRTDSPKELIEPFLKTAKSISVEDFLYRPLREKGYINW